jgi:aminoglycoside phosphotransferase family enzyme/predicted kinase
MWDARRRMVDDLFQELRGRTANDDVRIEETHISWVLLAGGDAYKIKKPVALPFLDFSTFEARERACRNEVIVNRRLAPRTYLGVVPVRRLPDGRSTFGPRGVVVDWAVRMVRLDDRLRADVLLAERGLTREHVDRLAAGLAAFHADARTDGRIARFGRPELIEANAADNFEAMRSSIARYVKEAAAQEIERWQIAFLRGHRDVFERRIASGAIRDGHGDLRLEHVFFRGDGDFDVIDAIEFDDRYRFSDVAADVAFLAMDLARSGRVDLAERFLASYARASNDFDMYRVVDFYESYRACVRAKIAALVAANPDAPRARRDAARAEARRYLVLAQSAPRSQVVMPTMVAVGGGIASGKSTLAEMMATELSAPVVDADRTRKHMLGVGAMTHVDSGPWQGAYDPAFSERVYAEVLRRADAVLASGRSVVVDASFRTRAARAAARDLASSHGVPFRFFECVAPIDLCRERLVARDRATAVSDARPPMVDAFAASFEQVDELCPTEHIRIDTARAVNDALEEAKTHLETWPRGLVE